MQAEADASSMAEAPPPDGWSGWSPVRERSPMDCFEGAEVIGELEAIIEVVASRVTSN